MVVEPFGHEWYTVLISFAFRILVFFKLAGSDQVNWASTTQYLVNFESQIRRSI